MARAIEMDNKVEKECVQRLFGHCIVEWEIEGYGFAAHGMKYEIKSPLFTIRPQMTTWRMSLETDMGLCDDTEISFCLERTDDSGPEFIWVNLDVLLFDKDKSRNGPRGEYFFKRKDSTVLKLPNIYYGRVNRSIYDFFRMTLKCQMIVHEKITRWIRRNDSIYFGFCALSIDCEFMYGDMKHSDVTLKLNNGSQQAKAQKAILSARSKGLNDLLRSNDLPDLNFETLHHDEVQQVLKYIYTGDAADILQNPSVSAYECIKSFHLKELEDHFTADEYKINSDIEQLDAGTMWIIENFIDRKELCISRTIYGNDMIWELKLYPRGIKGKGEHLTVVAQHDGYIDGDVWVKVEIFHDEYDREWKTLHPVKKGELFELHNFESRKSVLRKLKDGALKFGFKANASVGVSHSSHLKVCDHIPVVPYEDYYKKLSDDIFSLRKDDKYADIIITAQGREFKAHKCILSARSVDLRHLPTEKDAVHDVGDISPDIVELVLDYTYSGILEEMDFETLLKVYDAAWKIGINYLRYESSQMLIKSLNEDNLNRILMSAAANRDEDLREEVLKVSRLKTHSNGKIDED